MPIMKLTDLIRTALDGLNKSYVPYSHFHVSAALLCKDGTVYTGANIENAAYTPTTCAERVAFFKAIHDGKREFEAIVICGGKDGIVTGYCSPCGVCRQVMREFCSPEQFQIILAKSVDDYKTFTLEELLPLGFALT